MKLNAELGYVIKFIVIIIPTIILYIIFSESAVPSLLHKSYGLLSAFIINVVTPGEMVRVYGRILASHGVNIVKIGSECDGAVGMLILSAALLAFPNPPRSRFRGIILGIAILSLINLARIIALYYVCKYHPGIFEFSHIYLGQALFVFTGILFFFGWNGLGSNTVELTNDV